MTVLVLASGLAVECLDRLDHVYSWDQLRYHQKAVRLSYGFQSSFVSTTYEVARSVRHDSYNDLAAVPLAGWLTLFGEDRRAYVLGIVCLYAIPASALFALMMCVAYRRYCGRHAAWWLAAGWLVVPWLIGGFWTPTMLGRVAVGGLAFLFAAVALYLWRTLEEQRWWVPAGVGGLLTAAFLFRRWYIFAVVAILAAIAIQALLAFVRHDGALGRAKIARNFGLLLLTPASLATVIAMPVFSRIFDAEYSEVFRFFHHEGSVWYLWGNPWSVAQRLGLPSMMVVLAALILGWRCRPLRGFAAATAVVGVVSLAAFARVQAPGVHHVLLWVGVECTFLGIGLVEVSTWRRPGSRIAVGLSVVMLSTSVVAVLFFSRRDNEGSMPPWWSSLAPSLTVGDFLPKNLDVVLATVGFLEENLPAGSSIALLPSTLSLNDETLRLIGLSLPSQEIGTRYEFLRTRSSGPRGGFPDFIFRADDVVVIGPVATHRRRSQEVIRIPARLLFRGTGPFAECFKTVAGPTTLPDGRTISAFELRRGTGGRARSVLAKRLETIYPDHPELFDPSFEARQ